MLQGETAVDPNTNPTDNTQNNPLEASYPGIFTTQLQNPSAELLQ